MFIIKFDDENGIRYNKLVDDEVLFDENTIKIGDKVTCFHQGKKVRGLVELYTDDADTLNENFKILTLPKKNNELLSTKYGRGKHHKLVNVPYTPESSTFKRKKKQVFSESHNNKNFKNIHSSNKTTQKLLYHLDSSKSKGNDNDKSLDTSNIILSPKNKVGIENKNKKLKSLQKLTLQRERSSGPNLLGAKSIESILDPLFINVDVDDSSPDSSPYKKNIENNNKILESSPESSPKRYKVTAQVHKYNQEDTDSNQSDRSPLKEKIENKKQSLKNFKTVDDMNKVDSLSSDEDENIPFDMLPAIHKKNKRQFTETLQSMEKKRQQPSPTKEELQLQIKELLKKVNSKKLKKAHVRPITWESTDDNNDKSQKNHNTITSRYDDHHSGCEDKLSNNTIKSTKLNLIDEDLDQLYGKDFPNETMKHIGQNIYCKRNIYKFALTATSDTSIAQRYPEGMFKRETLLEATMTIWN